MATCPGDDPTKMTAWIPVVLGAGMTFDPEPPAFVEAAPWLTPSMKTVPLSFGASRSNRKTKLAAPLASVAGALIADGALIAFGSPWNVTLPPRPLVAPVRTHCAVPTPGLEALRKRARAPFVFAANEPVAQPVRLTASAGWKPSPTSPRVTLPVEATTGRSK